MVMTGLLLGAWGMAEFLPYSPLHIERYKRVCIWQQGTGPHDIDDMGRAP